MSRSGGGDGKRECESNAEALAERDEVTRTARGGGYRSAALFLIDVGQPHALVAAVRFVNAKDVMRA